MAGVVKSMDSALKSMNLEKVLDCEGDLSGLRKSSLNHPQAHSQLSLLHAPKLGNGSGASPQEISTTVHDDCGMFLTTGRWCDGSV